MNHLLDESWKDLNQIIIYGFGRLAQGNIDRFIDEFDVKEIIDNKEGLSKGKSFQGIPIHTQEQSDLNEKIIILAVGMH